MNLAESLSPTPAGSNLRHLALGFFDGLHLGHQRVILGGTTPHIPSATAVLTFREHPLSILHPEKHPALITGLPHKLRVLERWNIGLTIALPFNSTRSQQEPAAFLAELSSAFPSLQTLSVGPTGALEKIDQGMSKFWPPGARKVPSLWIIHPPSFTRGNESVAVESVPPSNQENFPTPPLC